jgi:predicted NBD/HSP70 family sugar kinase
MVGLCALAHETGVVVEPGDDPVAYAERLTRTAGTRPGLTKIGDALGRGVAQLAATLAPRTVVLGGAFVPLGEMLRLRSPRGSPAAAARLP